MSIITTKRLILRPVKWKDVADYNEYASIPQIGYMSGWRPHSSRLDTLVAIKNLKESQGHYAIEFENKMIGTASIQPDDKRLGLKALMLGYSVIRIKLVHLFAESVSGDLRQNGGGGDRR